MTPNLKLTPLALGHNVSEDILAPLVLQDYNHFALLDSLLPLHDFPIKLFQPQTTHKEETEKL